MLLLDTDHLSLLDIDTSEAVVLGMRLAEAARRGEQVAVTIITYEEQMRGWLAYLAKADTQARLMPIASFAVMSKRSGRYRLSTTVATQQKCSNNCAANVSALERWTLRSQPLRYRRMPCS